MAPVMKLQLLVCFLTRIVAITESTGLVPLRDIPAADDASRCSSDQGVGANEAALVQLSSKREHSLDANDLSEDGEIIDKVVFIKTHACGSSTLTSILHWFCENHNKHCFIYPEEIPSGSTILREQLLPIASEQAGTLDIWPNHVTLETDLLDALIPGNFKISLFREPLSRLLSCFRHGSPDAARNVLDELKNGTNPDTCGSASMKMSKQVPVEQFHELDFILLTEEYDLSLMMLRRVLGWSVRDMLYRRMKDEHNEELTQVVDELQIFLQGTPAPATSEFLEGCTGGNESVVYDLAKKAFEHQWNSFSAAEQLDIKADLVMFQDGLAALEECCDSHAEDVLCQHMAIDNVEWNKMAREIQDDGIVHFTGGTGSPCMVVIDAILGHNATVNRSLA